MKIADNIIGNILGKPRSRGGKKDWDGDGIRNKKDCQPRNTMRQDNNMPKCTNCGKKMDPLEVFPGGICVDCHEKKFDKELERTGKLPKPNFLGTINR